jgi:hypothetical protein
MLILAAAFLALAGQGEQPALPTPPRVNHVRNPDLRAVTTVFICDGVERRFSLRYDRSGFQEFLSASRDGVVVSPAALRRVSETLRTYDNFTLTPQCSEQEDLLTAYARRNDRYVDIYIVWRGDRMWVNGQRPGERPR